MRPCPTGRRCCRRSTASSTIATAPRRSSASTTGWRCMYHPRSASTATTSCRSWPATGSSAARSRASIARRGSSSCSAPGATRPGWTRFSRSWPAFSAPTRPWFDLSIRFWSGLRPAPLASAAAPPRFRLPDHRLAPGRLAWRGLVGDGRRDRPSDRLLPGDLDPVAVVRDLELLPFVEGVRRLGLRRLDLQQPAAEAEAEGEPLEPDGKLRGEAEEAVVVAHAPEAGDGGEPGAGERGDVDAVAGVVLEVVEVHQRCLAEVVVGELEVPDLGGHHGLR